MSSPNTNSEEMPQARCQQCGAMMLREMRFCRCCGHRLGEGVAEYTETIRLAPKITVPQKSAQEERKSTGRISSPAVPGSKDRAAGRGRRSSCSPRGMIWLGIVVLVMSVAVTGPMFQSSGPGTSEHHSGNESRTYLGASNLEDAEGGGAFVSGVSPPGGPLDRAGLVGGDIIKEFDNRPITGEDDLTALLEGAPAAKTATLTYLRDGELQQTTVTTATVDEIDRLADAVRDRAEGLGYMGVSDLDRVQLPGVEIYGVQIGDVRKNRPADIAGLRQGDIVKEFDGIPIRTEKEFKSRCERALPGTTVSVTIVRGSETLVIPVKMGRD